MGRVAKIGKRERAGPGLLLEKELRIVVLDIMLFVVLDLCQVLALLPVARKLFGFCSRQGLDSGWFMDAKMFSSMPQAARQLGYRMHKDWQKMMILCQTDYFWRQWTVV